MSFIPSELFDDLEKILNDYDGESISNKADETKEPSCDPDEYPEILASPSLCNPSEEWHNQALVNNGFNVVLEKDNHLFRHAKEVQSGSRGGYLEGCISLPKYAENNTVLLELSVIPCNKDLAIHPHLLHLTVFGESQKRTCYKTALNSPSDWRLTFKIVNCRKVFHIPNDASKKEIPLPDYFIFYDKGQPNLILGKNNLLVNIISSLQCSPKGGKSSSDCAITNFDVIHRRILDEGNRYPNLANCDANETAKKLIQKYSSKDHKIELQRCKLRAYLSDPVFPQTFFLAVSPNINNSRDKNVGHLNPRTISDPGMCCTEGGWRFLLISEHKLAKDKIISMREAEVESPETSYPVVPRLELTDDNNCRIEFSPGVQLNQISTDPGNFEVHGDAFSFMIPPQDAMTIDWIKVQGFQIRIFLYRNFDQKHSDSSVGFSYMTHNGFDDGACPFCIIRTRMTNYSGLLTNSSNGKSRKRTKLGLANVLSPNVSSTTMSPISDISSSMSSPSSSVARYSPHYQPGYPRSNQSFESNNFDDSCFLESLNMAPNGYEFPENFQALQSQESYDNGSIGLSDNDHMGDEPTLEELNIQANDFSNMTLHFEWDNDTCTVKKSSIVTDSMNPGPRDDISPTNLSETPEDLVVKENIPKGLGPTVMSYTTGDKLGILETCKDRINISKTSDNSSMESLGTKYINLFWASIFVIIGLIIFPYNFRQ